MFFPEFWLNIQTWFRKIYKLENPITYMHINIYFPPLLNIMEPPKFGANACANTQVTKLKHPSAFSSIGFCLPEPERDQNLVLKLGAFWTTFQNVPRGWFRNFFKFFRKVPEPEPEHNPIEKSKPPYYSELIQDKPDTRSSAYSYYEYNRVTS